MTAQRHPHLDNLRTLMVLAVVLLHAAIGYSPMAQWWYAFHPGGSLAYAAITAFTDAFPLPALFLLAGYFALPSLDRRGVRAFVRAKLKRLGLPLLALVPTVIPIVTWVAMATRMEQAPAFSQVWTDFLADFWQLSVSVFDTPESTAETYLGFTVYHLWFVSMLLGFFLLAIPLRPLLARFEGRDSRTRILLTLLTFFLVLPPLMGLIATLTPAWAWINAKVVVFQPVRLPLYLGAFGLGLWARTRGWLDTGRLPGPLWAWLLAALASLGLYLTIYPQLVFVPHALPWPIGTAAAAIRTATALTWTGLLLNLCARWWTSAGPVSASLARSSYDIYLLHLPLAVALQMALLPVALPIFAKFLLVLTISIALPWAASRFLIRPRPLWAVSAAIAVPIVLSIIL